jgi:hypothetical protein
MKATEQQLVAAKPTDEIQFFQVKLSLPFFLIFSSNSFSFCGGRISSLYHDSA